MPQQDDTDQAREFEPSQRKLDEQRRRGDLPRSADLTAALASTGVLIALWLGGAQVADETTRLFAQMIRLSTLPWPANPGGLLPYGYWARALVLPLLLICLVPAALVLVFLLASRGIVFATDKLVPRLDKLSPIRNAKQKFGLAGWVEFLKSLLKLSLMVLLVVGFLTSSARPLIGSARLDVGPGLILTVQLVAIFFALSLAISGLIGLGDFGWQRFRYLSRLRMTRQELKQETRESEGDPQLKQRRRQKAYDIATNRMLLEVKTADVVLVNPQHYAVALRWDRGSGRAPRCVAKGTDELALRIRELADTHRVPIYRDPPTARALFASVRLNDEIHPEQYKAVAAAIRFAERIRAARRQTR